jgi:hypothetical protein
VHVFLGGEPDLAAFEAWRPYLGNTMMTFVPASLSEAHRFYYAQIDSLFRCSRVDADVLIRTDADTLVVRNFEDLLDLSSIRSRWPGEPRILASPHGRESRGAKAGWAWRTCSPAGRSSLDMPTRCHPQTPSRTIGPRRSI